MKMKDNNSKKGSDFFKNMAIEPDAEIGVAKRIEYINTGKPKGFFRTKEVDENARFLGVQDPKDGVLYFLPPSMHDLGIPELRAYILVPYADPYGNLFVWPLKAPKAGQSQGTSWYFSAEKAAEAAVHSWIKIESNKAAGTYDMKVAESIDNEPDWHNLSTEEIIEKAITGKIITSPDDGVIRRLLGRGA